VFVIPGPGCIIQNQGVFTRCASYRVTQGFFPLAYKSNPGRC
jgi:hypothetical protein